MSDIKRKALLMIITSLTVQHAFAAVALDRTRIIYDGSQKTISLNITNQNKDLPFLAQSWIENEQGEKIKGPLMSLPPVQRIEPGAKSMVKLQSMPDVRMLPQDRESLYYFNLREIPPRSDKANVLQIALQTRVKLFYRPDSIKPKQNIDDTFQKITLTRDGNFWQLNNDTPYYFTIINVDSKKSETPNPKFTSQMVNPLTHSRINIDGPSLGTHPVLTYINDFGARPTLTFSCSGNECHVIADNENK